MLALERLEFALRLTEVLFCIKIFYKDQKNPIPTHDILQCRENFCILIMKNEKVSSGDGC